MDELETRQQLKRWILGRSKQAIGAGDLRDDTPLIERGILTSLDVTAFVLYIETLRGKEIDVDDLEPEFFDNVDAIWTAFFAERR